MTFIEQKLSSSYQFLQKLSIRYFRNKYVTTVIAFLIWMLFFDSDSIIHQIQRKWQIHKLNNEIVYYQRVLRETKIEEKALTENDEYFEKFVREKYLLKKEDEDLFIFSTAE